MLYLGVIGERPYFNPAQSELKENRGFYHIRNVGEAVSILALCPEFKIGTEQITAVTAHMHQCCLPADIG